jgi:methyltransferase
MTATAWAYGLIAFLIVERLLEVRIARRNRAWILARGGAEHRRDFTRLLFLFHGLWFSAFSTETLLGGAELLLPPAIIAGLVILLQGLRYYCIFSLGRFWNTRILVLPGARPVRRGPYRWLRHPNYLVVLIEIPLYPALFGCFYTALLFGAANLLILKTRIKQEEQAMVAVNPGHPAPRRAGYC